MKQNILLFIAFSFSFTQVVNAQGIIKDDFLVNDDTGNEDQSFPSISMDAAGDYVIVWQDDRYGQTNPDIIAQRYFSNGNPNGGNYLIVNDGPNNGEISPVVCADNSSIVFSWQDNRRSQGWDIYAKIVGWNWNGVTDIEVIENNILEGFSLSQNYPNPSHPTTKIKFTVPQDARGERREISLKVYDVLRNEVATLVNDEKPAGEYEVEFQSLVNGHQLPTGVYFYQLKAGNYIETKKMVLMK